MTLNHLQYDFGDPAKNDRADGAIEDADLYWRTHKVRIVSYDGPRSFGTREGVIYDMGRIRCYVRYTGKEAAEKRENRSSEYDFSTPWHTIKEILPIGRRF